MTDNVSSGAESVEDNPKFRSQAPTSRGVTLAMLIKDGIIKPGTGVLSIDYLGRKFVADLLADGRIFWPEGKEEFGSPSAWAVYCKRLSNPDSRSGCGWASVKYLGRKLDSWKTTWYRYTHRSSPEILTDIPAVDIEATELDARRLPPLDYNDSGGDCNQVVRTIQYSQIDVAQPYKIEIDSSLLLLMAVLAGKGHDLNGILLGTFNDAVLTLRTAVLMTHDEREIDVRSRIISRCGDQTFVGWFSMHVDYLYCGPTLAEVTQHSAIQDAIRPVIGMIVNCQKAVPMAFMIFYTVKPEGQRAVPVELEAQVVDTDNLQQNYDEFVIKNGLSMTVDDALVQSPLMKKIPDSESILQKLASMSA